MLIIGVLRKLTISWRTARKAITTASPILPRPGRTAFLRCFSMSDSEGTTRKRVKTHPRREIDVYQVDAFTSKPFAGNPAAVCLVPKHLQDISDEQQLQIAAEMNLSETAFVSHSEGQYKEASQFGLRWFTPTREVPLCGHATLASSAVLLYELGNENKEITFDTLSGPLVVKRAGNRISMDLPYNLPVPKPSDWLLETVSLVVGKLPILECQYSATTKKLLVRLEDSVSREQLEALKPDTTAMQASHTTDEVRGIMVTVKGSAGVYDFISRYFAPWNGIPEDPVTGSAHTVLAPYWSKQLGKDFVVARQCSPRGGDLYIQVREVDNLVTIAGEATVVLRGQLLL